MRAAGPSLCYLVRHAPIPKDKPEDAATAQVLAKNIWELERQLEGSKADEATRLALLKARKHQLDHREAESGVREEDRAFIKIQDRLQRGILLIHGSTGSPADMRDLASVLFGAGYSVFVTRLPRHGQPQGDLDRLSWRACLTHAEEAYRMLATCCDEVVVVGLSFGAALALQLNVKPRPRALALLAPAIYPKLNLVQKLAVKVGLNKVAWFRKQIGWDAEVLGAMQAIKPGGAWAGLPILALIHDDDPRVDPTGLDFLKKQATHRDTVIEQLGPGGHMVNLGPAQAEVERRVVEFVQKA